MYSVFRASALPSGTVVTILLAVSASPAFSQPRVASLESVRVSAGKEAVRFKTPLDAGQMFLLKATGTNKIGDRRVDAASGTDAGVDVEEEAGVGRPESSGLAAPTRTIPTI